ncbi:MAG: hypothetical protein AB7G68_16695 [Nitrospiraceae bacterium]
MSDSASLGTTSHLVSHLLREIEGALRDVLETLREREQRLKKSKKDGNSHKEEIMAILKGLQIPETDPVAAAWLCLPGQGNSYGLSARAHRNALMSARPVDDDFRQVWNDMQGIFDVVLEKFETSYLGVYNLLDQLLAKPVPDQADVDKLKNNVPNNIVAHAYFFDRLTSPSWLDLLHANGLFSHPPAPEVDNEKGTIGYPAWPQSRYLARTAPQVPEKVLRIMLAAPHTENFRIYDDLAVAAAAMPAEQAAKWSEREVVRIHKQDGLGLLPNRIGRLVNHLLQGNQTEAALNLARSLLEIFPDPKHQEQAEVENEFRLSPEPRARCSAWEYKRIIEHMIPLLPPDGRMPAFDLFCDLLEKAVTLSRSSSDEEAVAEDYSYIWHPHLEDKPRGDHLKNILVPAIRDVAHVIASQDATQVPTLVEKLENRSYEICHRLALDLLRRFPDRAESLIAARLMDRRLFDARGTLREYELLAVGWFDKLQAEDQHKILGWIEGGPGDDEAYKRWHKELSGHEPSDEQIVQHKKRWQRDRLTLLHKSLSADWQRRYEELTGELGKPENDYTENSRAEVWRGPTSPLTAADFQSMSVQEIVTYLRSWEPPRGSMSPSREGLCRQLTETVHKDAMRFASEAPKFQSLDPTYVRGFLQGFRQAVSETVGLPWSEVLSLCNWVVQQPISVEGRQVDKWGDDPDWGWTRKTIAGLLGIGLEEGHSKIPFAVRREVWNILENLTNDPDPSPDDERTMDEPIDPPHLAINSTRGEAMQTLIRYALWVRNCVEKLPDGAEGIARGFEAMPEVREVLETHLNPATDPSLAIRSVYGRWFPSLAYLDAGWTKDHVREIFPLESSLQRYRDAAWDTYIVYCYPYTSAFDLLKEEYGTAIERLGMPGTTRLASDSTTHLAQHLMVFYWLGKLPVEDETGLLAKFHEKATDALLGEALEFVGRNLSQPDEPLSEEISVRLKKLWEKRLAAIRDSGTPANHAAELAAFGWWFVSQKFDDAWAIAQLLAGLSLVQKAEPDHLLVERLVCLAATMPLEVVQCLSFMVQGDKEGWGIQGWRDETRKILATSFASRNPFARQAAIELINRLAARGMPDYKELLPGSVQSSPPAT